MSFATRRKSTRGIRNGGWIMVEMMVSVGLLAMLIWTVTEIQADAARVNHQNFAKQHCLAAAEAALDWVAATGRDMPQQDARRLWPKVALETERREGEGQWTGLELVKVVAIGQSKGREIRVELARYVAKRGGAS
jgi:type II secretory pathway pseudopilin PulG